MPLPSIIPWEPSHIPLEIQAELKRRRKNISHEYVPANNGWNPQQGPQTPGETAGPDWFNYKGPQTAWVRMCSNGKGREEPFKAGWDPDDPEGSDPYTLKTGNRMMVGPAVGNFPKKRFVLFGGKDFESTYGFKTVSNSPNTQIIGYMPKGKPHTIDNEITSEYPIHVPSPEILRVEMTIQKELLRRAVIEWVCFSWAQLNYMIPYFLTPAITVMVEMGWNHFNPESLVDLTNDKTMRDLWENPYPLYENNIIWSRGNYDVIYGLVTNFNWSVDGNNRYTCTTEITSKNRLYAGLPLSSEIFIRSEQAIKDAEKNKKNKAEPAKTMGNLVEFINDTNLIQNFRSYARYGPKLYQKYIPKSTTKIVTPVPVAGAAQVVARGVAASNPVLGAAAGVVAAGVSAVAGNATVPISSTVISDGTVEEAFFKDIYDKIKAIKDEEKKQLKLSYLYGVFDGRDPSETNTTKNGADFDQGQAENRSVWFSMGLISTLINIFSDRSSATAYTPMFELDIDEVLIGAHPNLISADGRVMIVPNPEAPKFFWGKHKGRRTTEDFKNNPDYFNQYVKEIENSTRLADITLQNVLDQTNAARDDLDVWINRNVYRLNPPSIQSDEDKSYTVPKKGSRSIATNVPGESAPCGYLRDVYLNTDKFVRLIQTMCRPEGGRTGTFYDLISEIVKCLNDASGGFWNLQMVDNGLGKWTIVDGNFSSIRNGNKGEIMIFDMHDAHNIIKGFKFSPQLSDAQATRVLYGEISNPKSQFYSKEEIEAMDFSFKDTYLYNDAGGFNKSYSAQNSRFEEIWKNVLFRLQVVDQDSSQTFQMKIQRDLYTPHIESGEKPEKKFRYLKFALPPDIGYNVLRKILDDNDWDNNPKYCAIQPGINAELTLQGIGGLRTFQCFLIKNLPEPYSHKQIVFQIINVIDHMEAGKWETSVIAGIRPLRGYIRRTLSIPEDT